MASSPLTAEKLCPLTLRRGAHVSAASGLVCADGRVWVTADDMLHLASFTGAVAPGQLRRLLPGRLPGDADMRKARKPDFECLFAWQGRLLAFGSGSRPNRCLGVQIGRRSARPFSLEPLYAPMREQLDRLNVEGAFVQGGELVLLHRGLGDGAPSAVACWADTVLKPVAQGVLPRAPAARLQTMSLGSLDGVPLGFSDGCALDGGGWLFSAAAEDTRDAYLDGSCAGSVVGHVDARGRIGNLRRLPGGMKVEGIAAQRQADGTLALALVTDADDPAQTAWLFRARW